MSDPNFDDLIDSMYRAPRAGVPAVPPPVLALAGTTRVQRTYVPAAARLSLLAALREQSQSVGALVTRLNLRPSTVRTYLWRLQVAGVVAGDQDAWRLA